MASRLSQTQYYIWGYSRFNPIDGEFISQGDKFKKEIQEMVRLKRFEVAVVTHGQSPLLSVADLSKTYVNKETLMAPMMGNSNWPCDVWVPRK